MLQLSHVSRCFTLTLRISILVVWVNALADGFANHSIDLNSFF